jgi:hypothetical protein
VVAIGALLQIEPQRRDRWDRCRTAPKELTGAWSSQLHKDAHGNRSGTAVKDGKTVPVSVSLKTGGADAN